MTDARETLTTLLRNARRAGIYRLPDDGAGALAAAARASGMEFVACDLGTATELESALAPLGRSLAFPDWYGRNLDGLHDCLTDLSWRETPETVLLLSGCAPLQARQAEAFDSLLEVFASAIDYWKAEKHPFWVFIDTGAQATPTLPDLRR